jgi:serine/threonine protein kinase
MELCDHGSLHSYMESMRETLSNRDRRAIFFQVMLAVHVAKRELGVRFYDLKPDNFVVKTADPDSRSWTFNVSNQKFTLVMDKPVIVKVIDFDRSDTARDRGNRDSEPAITAWNFGTLEFIPTNYLTEPKPKESDEHDLASLGLIFLELVSPDNSLLELLSVPRVVGQKVEAVSIECPSHLRRVLKRIYRTRKNGFSALNGIGQKDKLLNILYRRLVFFGINQESTKGGLVWEAIDRVLVKGEGEYQADKKQFDDDRARFGLEEGADEKLRLLREHLVEFPGGTELLKKLCSVDPEKRGTVAEVFEVDFLQSFREAHEGR